MVYRPLTRGGRGKPCRRGPRGRTGPPGPPVTKPQVSISPKNLEADQGDKVTFFCSPGGNPEPEVTWSYNISSGDPANIVISGNKLEILNADSGYTGEYTCTAKSILGEAVDTGSLRVSGRSIIVCKTLDHMVMSS